MTAPDQNYVTRIAERIRSRIDPSKIPAEGLEELFNSYALLALSKGSDVSNEDVHDAWVVWATKFDPDNDSIVPFDQLSKSTQEQDSIFRDAIRAVGLEDRIS